MQALRSFWLTRMQHWLDKRIPARQTHQLNLRSIFIFPSWFGWGYLVMCACLFVLGTNYQNNLMLLLCYFLVALMLLNLFTSYLNFARLSFKTDAVIPVYAGHQAVLLLHWHHSEQVPNGLLHAHWFDRQEHISHDFDITTDPVRLPWLAAQRGEFRLPRVTCYSEYPLGLYRCWTHLDFAQTVLVYPAPLPCAVHLQRIEDDDGEGAMEQAGHDDFYALKPFVEGEPLHRVAWKNVAKGQQWVSKTFSQPQSASGYLVLPDHTNDVETELSKLCFQINKLSEQKLHFGLKVGSQVIAPDSGDAHKHRCLALLARYPARQEHTL